MRFVGPKRALTVAAVALAAAAPASAAAADKLPDLGMARLKAIQIKVEGGDRLLRFTTEMVNVGSGRFEARGKRPSTSTKTMTVTQRVYDTSGGYRNVSVPGTYMFWAGDGHSHWHVNRLQKMVLLDADNEVQVGAKVGFCFYDYARYWGSAASRFYTGCGSRSSRRVTMGMSVGWLDRYAWYLPGQYLDITNVPDGDYRLKVTADPSDWFLESNDGNNATWVDLEIDGLDVTVLAYGPSA